MEGLIKKLLLLSIVFSFLYSIDFNLNLDGISHREEDKLSAEDKVNLVVDHSVLIAKLEFCSKYSAAYDDYKKSEQYNQALKEVRRQRIDINTDIIISFSNNMRDVWFNKRKSETDKMCQETLNYADPDYQSFTEYYDETLDFLPEQK